MRKIYITALLLSTLYVFSQDQKIAWQKDLKTLSQDFLSGMTFTLDRQILLSGSSIQESNGLSDGSFDYHVVKLNQEGEKAWEHYFGGEGQDYLVSTISTREGGFLLSGTSFSNAEKDKKENSLGGSDVWIVRLSPDGNEMWQKTIGTEYNDESASIIESNDLGFFVSGSIMQHQELFGSKDFFITKIDKNGLLKNTLVFGGEGIDEVKKLVPTKDGGAFVIAYTRSNTTQEIDFRRMKDSNTSAESKKTPDKIDLYTTISASIPKTEKSYGEGDIWLIKLNSKGDVEWQSFYGGANEDMPKEALETNDGYIVIGESKSKTSGNKEVDSKEGTDLWIISVDKKGNNVWQRSFSFGDRDIVMSLDAIIHTNEENRDEYKGFLIGGYTASGSKISENDETFWLLNIATDGKEIWRKYIKGDQKKSKERLVSARMMGDGGYVLAGTSAEEIGKENWKVVKLGDSQVQELIQKRDIRVYPNPVEDYAYVEIGIEFKEAEITLHDFSGKQVQLLKTTNPVTKINTASLPQGVYVVTAKASNKIVNAKIIKK